LDVALILPSDSRPRHERLVEALREAIVSGRLRAGEKLPPTRTLATQLALSRGTVVAAYEELIAEGYCVARTGAGTFVAIDGGGAQPERVAGLPRLSAWGRRLPIVAPAAAVDAPRWDFSSGRGVDLFPTQPFGRALRHAADGIAANDGPGGPAGQPRLRAALAAYLARARAVRATADDIVVVSGSQQGIDLAARLLLDPGDTVVIEEPGYAPARAVFTALGARVVGVPVDSGGLRVDLLPEQGARLVYLTPTHQFPTGAVLTPERRLALLDWLARHDAWLLEDDYDSEYRYSGPPLPSLQGLTAPAAVSISVRSASCCIPRCASAICSRRPRCGQPSQQRRARWTRQPRRCCRRRWPSCSRTVKSNGTCAAPDASIARAVKRCWRPAPRICQRVCGNGR
jgi:GntR family transcriptional regulator / MocR family aminotransferase